MIMIIGVVIGYKNFYRTNYMILIFIIIIIMAIPEQ